MLHNSRKQTKKSSYQVITKKLCVDLKGKIRFMWVIHPNGDVSGNTNYINLFVEYGRNDKISFEIKFPFPRDIIMRKAVSKGKKE